MRVLVLYAHPDPESYCSALHRAVVESMTHAGHEVDDCDLYAEGFDPVLSAEERAAYHDTALNRGPVAEHVRRLEAADALVLVYPVWNFGFPAILKGYFDRVFLPGVSFRLEGGRVHPNLSRITRITAVTTYGATRVRAAVMGDPPRRLITRVLRVLASRQASIRYLALYDMNNASDADRHVFLARVDDMMSRF